MNRRTFLIGTGLNIAAPAVVRAASLMPALDEYVGKKIPPHQVLATRENDGFTLEYYFDRDVPLII